MTFRSTGVAIRRGRAGWAVPVIVALLAGPPLAVAGEANAFDSFPARTEVASLGPGHFVSSLGDEVTGVLELSQGKAARVKALSAIFQTAFDVEGMARFAAGLYWLRTKSDERQKYVKLFGTYVASIYVVNFSGYDGQKLVVTGERTLGDGLTAVDTRIISHDKETPVEFRVSKVRNDFRIVDIYAAGVSMLITKRDEFNSVLAREGMLGLMQRLELIASG